MASHLCVFHVATAGQNGPNLGTDEEEVVLVIYVVIEVATNKVISVQEYWVKPRAADINENVLSESAREELGLAEEPIRNGRPLESVIEQFDAYCSNVLGLFPPHSHHRQQSPSNDHNSALSPARADPTNSSLVLVTDGQLPLRQCLHPEVCTKGIDLPSYYNVFYDLRKEVRKAFPAAPDITSVHDMMTLLNLESDTTLSSSNVVIREAQEMGQVVQRLIQEGRRFENPETINLRLDPGICSKNEEVDSNTVVRARGLPWQSSDQDIARFFRGLNVARGGVALCLSPQGRRNGEALVRFVSAEHREMALKRHKHHIGNRYIEVYKASGEDFVNVAGGNNNEAQNFLSRGGQVIVRMRGLPYDCTAKQVVEFFESGEKGCNVMDGESGVLFVKKPDGRATGDAFVMFEKEEDGALALAKHRDIIGSRYIELFRSTTAEVQQVLNRSMDPRTYETQQPLIAQLPSVPLLPQQVITSGTLKDCIRLRGLPYEAQVEHILDFLGEHAKNIVYQGVHMVYNAQGQPSGEAFIQMDSESSAFAAAQNRHHRYMVFGKKQRYIEVFQCSGDDMHMVLTGGLALPTTPATPKALLSPGMLPWDPLSVSVQAQQAAHQQVAQAQAQAQQAAQAQHHLMIEAQLAALSRQQENLYLMGLAAAPPASALLQAANSSNLHHHQRSSTPATSSASSSSAIHRASPNSSLLDRRSLAANAGAPGSKPPLLPGLAPSPTGFSGGMSGAAGLLGHKAPPPLSLYSGLSPDFAALSSFPGFPAGFNHLAGGSAHAGSGLGLSQSFPFLSHPSANPLFLHPMHQSLHGLGAAFPNAHSRAPLTSFASHLTAGASKAPPGVVSVPAGVAMGGKRNWDSAFPGSNPSQDQQGGTMLPPGFAGYPFGQPPQIIPAVSPLTPRHTPFGYPPIFYWPYPSPPVSPTSYYGPAPGATPLPANGTLPGGATGPTVASAGGSSNVNVSATTPNSVSVPGNLVIMRGLPFNASVSDVLQFFPSCSELTADCVQLQRNPDGRPSGEALVNFPTRADAERAIQEKNRQNMGARYIELFMA